MAEPSDIEFVIDTYTPETMPMARLADYLSDLATLLGHKTSVHLIGIDEGSVKPQIRIDAPDVPKIQERIDAVRSSDAPQDAMRAYRAIDDRLARDNSKALLVRRATRSNLIEFPGRDRLKEVQPFSQDGALDGIVVAAGGRDNPPTVHLADGSRTYVCHANRELVKRMAPHIYGSPIRVSGTGRWERNQIGEWDLVRFAVRDFIVLKETPLTEVVNDIRKGGFSEWGQSDNALDDLANIRHE